MPSFCVPKNSSFTTRSGSFFVPVISIFGITTKEGLRPPFFVSFSSPLAPFSPFGPAYHALFTTSIARMVSQHRVGNMAMGENLNRAVVVLELLGGNDI